MYEFLVLMLICMVLVFPVALAVTGFALLVRWIIRWFLAEEWQPF